MNKKLRRHCYEQNLSCIWDILHTVELNSGMLVKEEKTRTGKLKVGKKNPLLIKQYNTELIKTITDIEYFFSHCK